ncbi:Cytochrome P450 superfamily protein, partial [Prunus dulcis]
SMRREEVALCVEAIRAAANSGSIVVDLSDNASSLSVYMSCRMVFGKKYMDVEFDGRGFTKCMKSVNKAFDTFFEKVIEQHLQYNDGERTKNFVDVMMGFMDLKNLNTDMLAASIDPSSTAVEWALSELMRHPKAMKKVQKELENVVGLDRIVEESDLEKLEYLNMVLKETLRLHLVALLLLPHAAIKDCTVNGYHIPKKSHVIINAWAIGRDPSAWTDAEEFIPERFEAYPIRLWPKTLPWMHLGLTVVQIVLAQLVHCFNWELPDSMLPEELDITEVFGLTISRAKHLLAIPFYRLHK